MNNELDDLCLEHGLTKYKNTSKRGRKAINLAIQRVPNANSTTVIFNHQLLAQAGIETEVVVLEKRVDGKLVALVFRPKQKNSDNEYFVLHKFSRNPKNVRMYLRLRDELPVNANHTDYKIYPEGILIDFVSGEFIKEVDAKLAGKSN